MQPMTRKQFLRTVAGTAGTAAISSFSAAAGVSKSGIKLGVTLYSYTGDYGSTTSLEDCIADAAAMSAEGIELLTETHIPGYPNPSVTWVKTWHGLMDRYGLRPSCYDCRVDTRFRKGAVRTVEGLLELTLQDMNLAKRLGFKILRPAWGVEIPRELPAAAWEAIVRKALPYAEKHDVKIAVEIRSQRAVDYCMQLIGKTNTKQLGLLVDTLVTGQLSHLSEAVIEAPEKILSYLPYTIHIRGRFHGPYTFSPNGNSWEMPDGFQGESHAYGNLIPLLIRNGYAGYISSEYEGPRNPILASHHLGIQQARLRRALGRM